MKNQNAIIFVFISLFLMTSQSSYAQGQCCKCFNTANRCTTECTHSSGYEWCGCANGCDCGTVCSPGHTSLIPVESLLENAHILVPNTGSLAIIDPIAFTKLASEVETGFTFSQPNPYTYFYKNIGMYRISEDLYMIVPANGDSFTIKNCQDQPVFNVQRS